MIVLIEDFEPDQVRGEEGANWACIWQVAELRQRMYDFLCVSPRQQIELRYWGKKLDLEDPQVGLFAAVQCT